jgi:hypothetical protein
MSGIAPSPREEISYQARGRSGYARPGAATDAANGDRLVDLAKQLVKPSTHPPAIHGPVNAQLHLATQTFV